MVVIGSEHPSPDLQNLSIVATTHADGPRTGTIGVIGPTRMRYSRAIAAVESVSHAMHRVLASD
jgi:heat-inducible transcriptional repressor